LPDFLSGRHKIGYTLLLEVFESVFNTIFDDNPQVVTLNCHKQVAQDIAGHN
jgi:hypothetical protein